MPATLTLSDSTCAQSGQMTKDLAICVHGTTKVTPDQYLCTEPFMDAIVETFNKRWSAKRSAL